MELFPRVLVEPWVTVLATEPLMMSLLCGTQHCVPILVIRTQEVSPVWIRRPIQSYFQDSPRWAGPGPAQAASSRGLELRAGRRALRLWGPENGAEATGSRPHTPRSHLSQPPAVASLRSKTRTWDRNPGRFCKWQEFSGVCGQLSCQGEAASDARAKAGGMAG